MKESFDKINDYTLRQTLTEPEQILPGYTSGLKVHARITRLFNFMAAQITTVTRDMTYESRGGDAGGSSSVATQTSIQNFSDVQSGLEIRAMHQKLIELKGKPPALDDILRGMGKKPAGLGANRS